MAGSPEKGRFADTPPARPPQQPLRALTPWPKDVGGRRGAATRAVSHMLDVGGHIVGVVLNDIDVSGKGYRSYYGHYSEYKADEPDASAK